MALTVPMATLALSYRLIVSLAPTLAANVATLFEVLVSV
jgi:hypothetical protein